MKANINVNVEIDFTDREIREFLSNKGYSLETKSVDIEIYPIGFEKRDVEVAIKKGQKHVTNADSYKNVFLKEVWNSKINIHGLDNTCKEKLMKF